MRKKQELDSKSSAAARPAVSIPPSRMLPKPNTVIPSRREPKDRLTARDVASTPDKVMIKKAARSVVAIVSTKPGTRSLLISSTAISSAGNY
ncbi:hypothetical protein GUJ93_ZPchr0458g22274 [Zizania palustris]|uniref:Uncharacterized protein n=1 Tax=Zizania palustris TaxID=103762 RepID=A0A8J5VFF1_ZIZPA|nr:hypothetical protein GUJ93_ZPchr0458g22274 [Zizania palustris]